jgi:hypothetical protein
MTIEHHFIVKYSTQNGWEWDTDSEAARYEGGTVWNSETDTWSSGYEGWNDEEGEAKYVDNDDTIGETLGSALQLMNGVNI